MVGVWINQLLEKGTDQPLARDSKLGHESIKKKKKLYYSEAMKMLRIGQIVAIFEGRGNRACYWVQYGM